MDERSEYKGIDLLSILKKKGDNRSGTDDLSIYSLTTREICTYDLSLSAAWLQERDSRQVFEQLFHDLCQCAIIFIEVYEKFCTHIEFMTYQLSERGEHQSTDRLVF